MPSRLLLTTDCVGGVWRYTLDLAAGLSSRGIVVVVAVLGPQAEKGQRREAEAIPDLHLVQTGLPLDWTADDADALARGSERLATLAALTGVDGVHLHAPALVGSARWPVPVVAVCHSCVGTWWRAVRSGPPPADFAWRVDVTARGLRRAARVIAPTSAHAEAMRAVYGPLAIAVVHNGAAQPHPVMAGHDTAGPAVLTAGRLWDEGKAAGLLDGAAPLIDAPIRAAGPVCGPNGATIDFAHLDLLGALDSAGMARAYASATVFASMARYEPFGLAVLEAARAGLRLVLSDIPSFRELWDGAATFVSDSAELAPALRDALHRPGDGGARERAGRYTVEAMVERTLDIHRALAGSA